MVRNGRAGWYYRVVEHGTISAGDEVVRVDRPHPDFAFSRLVEIVNFRNPTADELDAMAAMEGLAHGLRAKAQAALGRLP
jgi:MOSC domain-containing protein YiiM